MNKRRMMHYAHPSQRPALPLLLYDLGAADQELPLTAVLPDQFYRPPADNGPVAGERALRRAVLEDALRCFQKQFVTNGRRAQRLAREAEEWFFMDDFHWPFSFVNICAVLGLDPAYIRFKLKRWRERVLTEQQRTRQSTVPIPQPFELAA